MGTTAGLGVTRETPIGILQALQCVGAHCTLGKNKNFCHVTTAFVWLMLPALQNMTEKQIEAEAHSVHLEEELKL